MVGRLIEQEQLGLRQEEATQCDTASLTSREGGGHRLGRRTVERGHCRLHLRNAASGARRAVARFAKAHDRVSAYGQTGGHACASRFHALSASIRSVTAACSLSSSSRSITSSGRSPSPKAAAVQGAAPLARSSRSTLMASKRCSASRAGPTPSITFSITERSSSSVGS
eukprot:scaffold30697_cov28-Tisochrysis_lutea.AAC.5